MDKFEPKYIAAEKMIRESISLCKIDDKIPGERVLATELGISYMTVRKAVEGLVAKGILYKIPKKGTYVASHKEVTGKTKNIGYFLDGTIKDGLTSPYYSLIFNALEKEASNNGYSLIYFSDATGPNSLRNVRKIDGAIISCFPHIEHIIQGMAEQLPVVCIDNDSSDKSIPSITIDNYNSVVEAIHYLCSLGHKRIGFIAGMADSNVGRNRLAGYFSALKSCGLGKDMDLIYKGDYSFETGEIGADYLLSLDKQPTAIMCANDTMAIGTIKKLGERGLNVPDDISVIGFDDISVASHMTPALTTVEAPVGEIAKHSVDMLRSLINGLAPDNRHVTLPCRLLLRDSSAAIKESMRADVKRKTN